MNSTRGCPAPPRWGADRHVGPARFIALLLYAWAATAFGQTTAPSDSHLPGTAPLADTRDLALEMVAGIDRYFTRELAASVERREAHWHRDYGSPEAYVRSVEPNRKRFARIIGAVDPRVLVMEMYPVATTTRPARLASGSGFTAEMVRWPVFDGVDAEGLLLTPRTPPVAHVVALPDADWAPEQIVGITPNGKSVPQVDGERNSRPEASPATAFALRLVENGCRVLVPTLIDRSDAWSGNPKVRMTNQPHREFIYRMAFEMGRHVIGYEVQKTLAAVDWLRTSTDEPPTRIGVIGYGEGGLIAFYAAAVDTRIDTACVSGYFQSRQELWREPIYRNVWGLLDEFGDAEIAGLIAPRSLIVEAGRGPEVAGPPPERDRRRGAAPGRLTSPSIESVRTEVVRARVFYEKLGIPAGLTLITPEMGDGPGSESTIRAFLAALGVRERPRRDKESLPVRTIGGDSDAIRASETGRIASRQRRQFDQLVEYTQRLVRESHRRRHEFWAKAGVSSAEKWQESCAFYRDYLWDEVIGRYEPPSLPANPRTRVIYDQPKWAGYEVMLDVWPDVYAYGILLVPKGIKAGERRPVVVCQHGLEGRPQELCDPTVDSPYYHQLGNRLADRGFVVYAPQNPYIGQEKFRLLQRKANPLKRSLFSVIVRQHERTLEWLAGQPFVDPERIAFYGLSYGGMTAMRVPALLPQYCLSICSGNFNEWIGKIASIDLPVSYMFTHEYEMVEFDLGNTFNHAELAGLIAPRPFMVERGHHDSVATDEMVSWEYARVRHLYVDLGIGDRTTIEYFNGPHEIHGAGTVEFLHKHLNWPAP